MIHSTQSAACGGICTNSNIAVSLIFIDIEGFWEAPLGLDLLLHINSFSFQI